MRKSLITIITIMIILVLQLQAIAQAEVKLEGKIVGGGFLRIEHEIRNGNLKCVAYLIKRDRNILKKKSMTGKTPLHVACSCKRNKIAIFLVSEGADINARYCGGRTPLHLASYNGMNDVVIDLIKNGADVNVKDEQGLTPLHSASYKGMKNVVRYLIKNGADVNAEDINHMTPLHYAADKGNSETINILVENGADLNINNKDMVTPRDMIRRKMGVVEEYNLVMKSMGKGKSGVFYFGGSVLFVIILIVSFVIWKIRRAKKK